MLWPRQKKKRKKIWLQHQNFQSYRNINWLTRRTQRKGHWFAWVTSFYKPVTQHCHHTGYICVYLWRREGGKTAQKLCVCLPPCWFLFGGGFYFLLLFFKCSCTSHHLGTEMAMSKFSYKSKLLRLRSLKKMLFHSFYGSHIVFQQPVN